jgi:hypothetical protein
LAGGAAGDIEGLKADALSDGAELKQIATRDDGRH